MTCFLYMCKDEGCRYITGWKFSPYPFEIKSCHRCGGAVAEVEVEVPRPR